jgi:hypothetical protein
MYPPLCLCVVNLKYLIYCRSPIQIQVLNDLCQGFRENVLVTLGIVLPKLASRPVVPAFFFFVKMA